MAGRPDRLHVLIAGGGVAALEAMVALEKLAGDLVDVELLSPDADFFYRPLSVAEPFGLGTVLRFDLASLAHGCGARHSIGALAGVDAAAHRARTSRNATFGYDALLIAVGARPREALPGALTFRGEADVRLVRGVLDDLDRGLVRRVVFALPGGVTWPLPLYELALLTAEHLRQAGLHDVELTVVTPEETPLALLGHEASEAIAGRLREHGIALVTGAYPEACADGELRVVPGAPVPADVVLTLPRLRGVPLAGVPQDDEYFVHVDSVCRVPGLDDVYAAGDATTFPVKQGGLAAQQADVAAEAIAAAAGSAVVPKPFEPVLRGLVLDRSPLYLRTELGRGAGRGPHSQAADEPLWWPAGKIAARHLGPYLAEHAGLAYGPTGPGSVLQ
ncbi:MAG TPA: FAD/NAD(P)-binding oxidoreductase [Gaiellaceae bacterium]|nr:FAD/NAD(P)-binding oxidoreductase [Gaiellaceae bacterium]